MSDFHARARAARDALIARNGAQEATSARESDEQPAEVPVDTWQRADATREILEPQP